MNELIRATAGNKDAIQSLINLLSKRLFVWATAFGLIATSAPVQDTLWGLVVITGSYILSETIHQSVISFSANKVVLQKIENEHSVKN